MPLLRMTCILCALLFLPLSAVAETGKRVALVVGNASYSSVVPLANPENDANAMADTLTRLGFDVTLAVNQTQQDSLQSIEAFTRKAIDAEIALYYYSGHALQLDSTNFLLPVDLEVNSPSSVQYHAIDAGRLLRDLEDLAQTSIVILDACRDNPFGAQLAQYLPRSRSAGLTRGLQPMAPRSRRSLIAYAAAAGSTAADGEGQHSPYTEALLDEIETPGVEVGLMFRRVAGRVAEATRDGQQPELLIRLPEPIYLAAAPTTTAEVPDVPEARLPEVDAEASETSEDTTETDSAAPADSDQSPPDIEAGPEPDPDPLLLVELPERAGEVSRSTAPPAIASPPGADWGYPSVAPGLIYAPRSPWQPPSSRRIDETEDNNTLASAQNIQVSDQITMRINARGDVDHYRFSVGSAGVLHARIYDSPGNLDMFGRLLDFEGNVVADWQGADRPGGVMDAGFAVPGPGLYVLRISDGGSNDASETKMTLDLSFSASDDGYEPNNAFHEAKPVPLDFSALVTLFPLRDQDIYRMNVTRPGELYVAIGDVPENMDVFVRAYDLNLNVVADWQGPKRDGGDTEAYVHFAAPGVYFLLIKDGSDNASATAPFSLETRFRPADDLYEPNNVRLAAREIDPTGEHHIAIFPRRDVDYLSFTVDHPGTFTYLVEDVPEDMDVFGRIYNLNGDVIGDWIGPKRAGGDTVGEVDIARPGRYFLMLKDGSDDAQSWRGLKLTTRFQRQTDQYEPNNTRALASPLPIGGELAVNILPRGDADYFALNISQPGQLSVEIEDVPEDMDVFTRVYNLDGAVHWDWVGPKRAGGDTVAKVDFAQAGTYFLLLKDGSDDARSPHSMSLRTEFTPALDGYEPNGRRKSAAQIPVEGSDWINTFPRGDVDYFYFYLNRAGALDLLADQVPDTLDIYFRLYDANGAVVRDWIGPNRVGGDTIGTAEVPRPGWYWLQVKDGSDDASAIAPYRITRRWRPAG